MCVCMCVCVSVCTCVRACVCVWGASVPKRLQGLLRQADVSTAQVLLYSYTREPVLMAESVISRPDPLIHVSIYLQSTQIIMFYSQT